MEFLVNKCLVPSRVENWNIIVDLGSLSVADIPYSLKSSSLALEAVLKNKRFDLVESFYDDAVTESIIEMPEFAEYLKTVTSIPYSFRNLNKTCLIFYF